MIYSLENRHSRKDDHLRLSRFLCAFVFAFTVFLSPSLYASNPSIANGIFITDGASTPLEHDSDNEVSISPSDSSLIFTAPSDGAVQVEIDGAPATVGLDGQEYTIPLPDGVWGSSYKVLIKYIDEDGNECQWTLIVTREPGPGPKSKNGESDDSSATSDTPESPTSDDDCACKDPSSNESGTGSPTGTTDSGGGDSTVAVRSLHWELPFGLLPNETDLAQGKLLLSLSAPGENSASISNLIYASVATMRVFSQRTTDLDSGLSFSCRISQASGLPIAFEVKSGQSFGYPAGNNTNSRARIQLLGANGFPTTIPANAVSILQYRGQGGFVTFDRPSGKVTSYSTRTGRVTDFTGTDKIDIIYSDANESKIKQIRTDAGLLTITKNAAREYTVAIYAPGQFGTTKVNDEYPLNPDALARRTAVVSSDIATPDTTTITVDQSGREYKYVYEFTSSVLTHEWVMKRYLNDVLTTTKSKKVTYDTNGRTTERQVIDNGPGSIAGQSGDSTVSSSSTLSPKAPYGGYRHSSSSKIESSSTTSDQAINRTFTFFEDAGSPGSYARLKSHTLSDGREFAYEYDAEGRMTKRTSTYLDDPSGKVETYSYARHAEAGLTATSLDLGDYRPRTTTVTLNGTHVDSLTFLETFTDASNNDEYVVIQERAATKASSFGDAANFRTISRYYGPTAGVALQGRLKSVVNHNGTGTTYTYSAGSYLDHLTTTVESTLNSSLAPVPAFSSRSVTVKDSRGALRSATSGVFPRGANAYTDYQEVTCDYDGKGYKTKETKQDLLTNRLHVTASYVWESGLLQSSTDASGVTTSYVHDVYDRVKSTTRAAIPASGTLAAQAAITTTITGTLSYNNGSYGWQGQTTTTTGGALTLTSSNSRDYRGRRSSSTDVNGYTTSYNINSTGTQTTVTHPNDETTTTTAYLDGRHKSTTGSASVSSYTSYNLVAGDLMETTRYSAINNGPRSATSSRNMLGQNVTSVRKALNGLASTNVTQTNHYEVGTGYLLRSSSTAADVPDSIMEYNSIGVLTRRGQSQDSTLILASDDRITDVLTGVESDAGSLWSVNETTLYPTLDSATAKVVSTSRSRIAGFSGDLMSYSEGTDINGNLSYQQSELQLGAGGIPQGIATSRSNPASISGESITTSYFGRTASSQTPGVTGVVSYTYDGLGRTIHTKDPRHTGDYDTVYFAGSNQVDFTKNAKDEKTSYTYHPNGTHGAGQVATTTLPDGTVSNTIFDAHGLTLATWGTQTNTRHYSYDLYDQMTELRTWKIDPAGDFTDLSGAAVTTWTYHAGTGILLTKRDADSKGADYSYDTAGRLASRKSARLGADGTDPILTTYDYTQWGELDTVTYTNDPTGTRPLDYDYDRLGRLQDVAQNGTTTTPGTNTHAFAYNPGNLLIDTETIDHGNSGLSRVQDHLQDTFLRSQQHKLLVDVGSTLEHQIDLGYDPVDGRLSTVTDNSTATAEVFTYGYHPSSYGLVTSLTGPVHTVTNTYEPNRNVLTVKQNQETVGTVSIPSSYTYTVNSIGQRASLTRGGTEMSATNDIAWSYNSRGELVEEDYGDNDSADPRDRAFQYDAIGNRQKSQEGNLTLPGTANYVTNSVNEYTSVNLGTAVVPAYDHDGNATAYPLPVNSAANAQMVWDAENRLISVTLADSTVVSYEYDYIGRRIAKTANDPVTNNPVTISFIYHGWNLCAEYTGSTLDKTYTCGMDLSGSMQGAGGVGGLLSVRDGSDVYYPTYDGNGNVSEYLNSTGTTVAHYEYDAFGNTTVSAGAKKADFAHRFSTKYEDAETGLYYYGYRYYDPVTGRWPSRDPIEEAGGINLYGMVGNNAVSMVDVLGMMTQHFTDDEMMGKLNIFKSQFKNWDIEQSWNESFYWKWAGWGDKSKTEWVQRFWIDSEGCAEGCAKVKVTTFHVIWRSQSWEYTTVLSYGWKFTGYNPIRPNTAAWLRNSVFDKLSPTGRPLGKLNTNGDVTELIIHQKSIEYSTLVHENWAVWSYEKYPIFDMTECIPIGDARELAAEANRDLRDIGHRSVFDGHPGYENTTSGDSVVQTPEGIPYTSSDENGQENSGSKLPIGIHLR